MKLLATAASILCACSNAPAKDTPVTDAGAAEDALLCCDDAADSSDAGFVPADHPAAPQLMSLGGPVLKSPAVTLVAFPGDSLLGGVETFVDALGKSTLWKPAIVDYGIGLPKRNASVQLASPAPTATDDGAISAWLATQLDGTHPEFGAPSDESIYVIFYPATTKISLQGSMSCSGWTAYHSEVDVGSVTVAYAVLTRCSNVGVTGLDLQTVLAAHEILEASADPRWSSKPAFYQMDPNHGSWGTFPGSEVVDLCEFNPNPLVTPLDLGHRVQRYWANSLAMAGSDPCYPHVSNLPYFNSAPDLPDMAVVGGQPTLAVNIPGGQSRTVALHLFSEAPTPGPWSVTAIDRQALYGKPATLGFAFDRPSGKNGDVLQMTIQVLSAQPGGESFYVRSNLGDESNVWFGFVTN